MKLKYLIFLAVMSVVDVSESKPWSNDVGKAPCIDCEQKNFRRKRSYQFVFTQADEGIKLDLGCLSCHQGTIHYTMTYSVSGSGSPNIYIGNGENNENHVVINGANKVYIGNGAHNTNYVSNNS